MRDSTSMKRIVILGGGFGGVYTARCLERLFKHRSDVEIVLVSRDNFLLMTPLLFEVFSGTLDVRHCSFPIRAFLQTTRFVEATVRGIDLERRVVHLGGPGEKCRIGLRPTGPGARGNDQPSDDPRFGARLHVQDPRRRSPAPQPRDRTFRAGRRGDRPAAQTPAAHVRDHRRRTGGSGVVRRVDRFRRRDHASLQARESR